jgi:hypothetical protein
LVCAPANDSSSGDPSRAADEEKRKVRRTKRSESARTSGASFAPNAWRTKSPRRWVPQSAICMLRESSISTARKFCCGTAALTTRMGRNRQKTTIASTARRSAVSTIRSRVRPRRTTPRYVRTVIRTAATATAAAMYDPVVGARRNSPC